MAAADGLLDIVELPTFDGRLVERDVRSLTAVAG
jgi:hypothetical protein